MGITGLLPFLENASRKTHIEEFRGCTAAVDAYCWLHRGAFGCAEKIVSGENTIGYVLYCMKYVKMLQSHGVRPILVFDGQQLPAKKLTEIKRRGQRELCRKKAAHYLRLGKANEANKYMRQCIDVTHTMALALIKECRRNCVDCIVAPYEADAQLAFLNIKNMAHFVITEDSDLLLFGCNKVFFKMDLHGCGTLVEAKKINKCMKLRSDVYTFDKFRHMSILSGCDYLDNLPGIGLKKALKFISLVADLDIYRALLKLPTYLKLTNVIMTNEYREAFMLADATFKHQLVYDPLHRKLLRLNDPNCCGTKLEYCANAGDVFDDAAAFQLALGNVDPLTRAVYDDWSPDLGDELSIWGTSYRKPAEPIKSPKLNAPGTKGVIVNVTTAKDVFDPSKFVQRREKEDIKAGPLRIKRIQFKNPSLKPVKVDNQSVITSRFFSKSVRKQKGGPGSLLRNELLIERNSNNCYIWGQVDKRGGVGGERQGTSENKPSFRDRQLVPFRRKFKFKSPACVSNDAPFVDVASSIEGSVEFVENKRAIDQMTQNAQLEDKTSRPQVAPCRRLGLPRIKNKPRTKYLPLVDDVENTDLLLF